MSLEMFFEKFELFAVAPNAVAKIRELVLQLALNGKLAGLDSAKWERVPLGTLGEWGSGGTPVRSEPQYYGGAIPWLVIGDLNDGVVTAATTFITQEGLSNSSARLLPKGVLLIAMYGSIGKLGITGIECATNQAIAFCKPNPEQVDLRFLFHTLKAIQPALLARGQGLAQKNISQTILKAWEIFLPPLAEQKRIVARVDELMALCDRLEAQQQERDTRHTALARASVARFAEAPTPANLDFLFHQSYAIAPADLRKTILTLAMQGKLVPQDPNDELPMKTFGKLAASAIKGNEDDDDFPGHWLRVPLGKLGEWSGGGTPSKSRPDFWKGDIPWVSPKDMKSLQIADAQDHISEEAVVGSSVRIIPAGSLLMVVRGMILARSFPVAVTTREVTINQDMKALLPLEHDTTAFLLLALRALEPQVLAAIERSSHGTCKLETKVLHSFSMPIPPLAEQRRIVAKVDHLMALVDRLEPQLAEARIKSAALLDAVIHELLNPTAEIIDLASYRTAVGCYAIGKMQGKRYFGRTAAMKVLYLAQAHVGLELGLKPMREAAGPFDSWLYRFEEQGEREAWFKVVDDKKKIDYRAGRALAEQSAQAERAFTADQRKELDRLLALFSDRTTEEAEIIATLFAAWNDFLIDGHEPSDDGIVREVRENWHEKKGRFTPALLRKWLGWLRQNDLVPQGRSPRTAHQTKLLLN